MVLHFHWDRSHGGVDRMCVSIYYWGSDQDGGGGSRGSRDRETDQEGGRKIEWLRDR